MQTLSLVYALLALLSLVATVGAACYLVPTHADRVPVRWVLLILFAASTLSTVISLLARRLECTRELLQIAWRALAVLTSGQCLASLFLLAASLSPPLRDWPASCAGDERCTEEAGRQSRVLTIFGAFQITLFLASVPVLLKLRRAINEDMCAVEGGEGDVPLGWHVPPEQFAPDSSESESDGHVRTRLLGRRAQSQDHHGLVHGRGHSWTEFKKQRSREAGVIRIS